jgi:hypothetical protein
MSDLLLLLDDQQCPACRRKHRLSTYGQCRNCGMMLFNNKDQWEKYAEDTGWRELWVYTIEKGWCHYSQLKMREEALSRVYQDDGKALTPEEQIQKIKEETRQKKLWYLKQKRKIKSFAR